MVTLVSNIIKSVEVSDHHYDDQRYEKYLKSKRNLARALRILLKDSPHLKELANEPEIFAMEFLKDAESGAKLSHYFREFCSEALNLLGKEFFVLPIDDIDMSLDKGFEILENIRRYISIDKILVFLSGFFSLYYNIVKSNFFKQFLADQSLHVPEKFPEVFTGDKKKKLSRLIDDLTVQYLLKIMPAYNRIKLSGINRKLWRKKIDEIKINDNGKFINFNVLWEVFSEQFFFYSGKKKDFLNPRECNVAILIPFSVRGFVNFIKILVEYYDPSNNSYKKISEFYQNLLSVFKSNFLKEDMEDLYEELKSLPGNKFLGTLVEILYLNLRGLNYWLLEPPGDPFSREGEDLRQIYLLIQLGIHISFKKRPFLLLDVINRLGLAFELINSYEPVVFDSEKVVEINREILEILEADFSEFVVKCLKYNDIRQTIGHLIGRLPLRPPDWWYGLLFLTKRRKRYRESNIFNTMVPFAFVFSKEKLYQKLYQKPYVFYFLRTILDKKPKLKELLLEKRTTKKQKKKRKNKENGEGNIRFLESPDFFPAVREWEVRVDETGRWLLYFFSSLYYPFKADSGSFWTVSIFTALANLQCLLEKELPEPEEELCEALKQDLPYFPLEGAIEEENEEGKEEHQEDSDESLPKPSPEWAKIIRAWWVWARKELQNEKTFLPAPVLSRSIHRLYDNLRAIKDELAPWERSLGFVVSRWILAFWQALLAEEVAFRSGRREYLPRIIRGAGLFEEKEQGKLDRFLAMGHFAKIFIYCPIFLALVEKRIRSHLLQREETPSFFKSLDLKKFNFYIRYHFRDQNLRETLGREAIKIDPYTAFCALTVPTYSAKIEINKNKFLQKLAKYLQKVANL
ncbi:MAG: hypothetical protein GXO01_06875 [Epsilonproteobacteria bacterium]|nr:hypothetical protein [Campylobacterota bacterium]